MSNTIRIEKFNEKNSFNLWRIKMRALLKEQRVWGPLASVTVQKEVATELKDKGMHHHGGGKIQPVFKGISLQGIRKCRRDKWFRACSLKFYQEWQEEERQ
ncbi:Retrovirus-related Pol polyprotein from transposon TNT 1-94 [Sesbania bispinosa]|nr:Retrovirus-related Pol polyprotein from transposon TNT 1-94 [Sesbania bispinosa]